MEQILQNNMASSSLAIGDNTSNSSSQGLSKKIDMSIIERIKSMRSQSRESSETLLQKRDEVIRNIQRN